MVTPVPTVPSPNAQVHAVMKPPKASLEPEPSNVTVSGAVPEDGVAVMTAVGGSLALTMVMLAMFEYAESPPALAARTR